VAKIDIQSFIVGDSAAAQIELATSATRSTVGDDPVIGDVDDAVELLRRQHATTDCLTMRFVVNDFPFLTVVWQQFGKLAAIAHVLRNGRADTVHLLLSGRDMREEARPIESLRELLGKSFPNDFTGYPRNGNDVFHHAFVIRPIEADDDDYSDLLGMICIVPIFCEVCGIH
jgi:hypothetical protein